MFIFKPGNIWSGSPAKSGLAVLTNPTEIAFRKGNLKAHYPISFMGETYADVEAAYQALKPEWSSKQNLMTALIAEKLKQYPTIMQAIEDSGGLKFLGKCSHRVYGKNYWEGDGISSPFIRCLRAAYTHALKTRTQQDFNFPTPAERCEACPGLDCGLTCGIEY